MSYEIKFSNQSASFFRNLQKDIQNRVKEKFLKVAEDPFRFLEHYEGEYYKLRIGDLRALIDIDFDRKILFVRVFDKRGRIYK